MAGIMKLEARTSAKSNEIRRRKPLLSDTKLQSIPRHAVFHIITFRIHYPYRSSSQKFYYFQKPSLYFYETQIYTINTKQPVRKS